MLPRLVLAVLACYSFLSFGCAFVDNQVDMAYTPTAESPLSSLEPMTIRLTVSDERETIGDRRSIGAVKNGYGMETAKVVSVEDIAEEIRNALAQELEYNGHTVVGEAEAADAAIHLDLNQVYIDTKPKFWDVELTAEISSDVEVSNPPETRSPITFQLSEVTRKSFQLVHESARNETMNEALTQFVRSFAFEQRLIEELKKAAITDPTT